jgi:GNAT superfamily N-acetyltransferase
MTRPRLEFQPLTPERWPDLAKLFGERGACGGCWCMWWRLERSQWARQKGEGNRRALRKLVSAGDPPGLLAYAGGQAVGWCALGPREVYTRLARARSLKPIDETPVWSVTCFFVAKPYRRQGLSVKLLRAAAAYARKRGARALEGYPVEPGKALPDVFAYTGLTAAFLEAGFEVVRRPSATRAIVRRPLR